jgi:hypothetical protein
MLPNDPLTTGRILNPKQRRLPRFPLLTMLFVVAAVAAHAQPVAPAPCLLSYVNRLPTEPCRDYRQYAPLIPEHTPIKNIRLVVHVVQQDKDSLPRNFEDNATGHDWINMLLWQLNVIYRNVDPPSRPVEECPSAHMKHSRIQFRSEATFFHQSSQHWNQNPRGRRSNGDSWCNIWDDLVASNPAISDDLRDNAFHVFLVHSTWSETHTGFSPGIGALHANFVVLGGYYITLFESDDPPYDHAPHGAAIALGHELGHAFGLYHTDGGDFCCDTYEAKTNNIMNSGGSGMTECQLARMHYLLESGNNCSETGHCSTAWKTIETDYCNKDDSYDIIIPGGQTVIWAAEKKLNTDVIVRSGAQLIIRCRIGLPDGADIVVENGARLIIDGGSVVHNSALWPRCDSGQWGGIRVSGNIRELPDAETVSDSAVPDPAGPGAVWLRRALIEHARDGFVRR